MATASPVSGNSQAASVPGRKSLLPPEEQFWQRYSANHEFPLSSLGSLTIYLFIGALIVAGIRMHLFDAGHEQPDLGFAMPDFDPPGGGGGDPSGAQGGIGDSPDKIETTKVADVKDAKTLDLPKEPIDLSKLTEDLIPDDPKSIDYTAALSRLGQLEKETQKKLIQSIGQGGSGSGGGKGSGVGTGTGNAKGPGNRPPLDERQKRVLRWNMVFDTRHGDDYRLQLQSLGAILAIPSGKMNADGEHEYLVIRDLRPPARPVVEDLRNIKRIFWVDNRPESVQPLAQALRLPAPPPFVVAFFPPELEDKLAKLEGNFARSRGRSGAITETRFRITLNGRTGKYEPMVVDMQ
jgi:hypothetical protein